MDEDLLFKTHNESKIPEVSLNHCEKQKQNTFCQNGVIKEECNSLIKTLKHRQEKTLSKVLQNYDSKTNILSNITLENNIVSPLLSNIYHYSFSSDCLFKIRRSNRFAFRNKKNENIFPTNKKMLILNDKCNSGLNSIMKNNSSDKIINRPLREFQEPCLSKRQSNLKRKLDSDSVNELNLKLNNINKNFSKSASYTERFNRTFSYSKHFKSDDAAQISDNGNKNFLLQTQFINRIDSIENNNFKQMKNIEIQSSPVKIRVAANFGEDSIEYIDPTMEVELDSDESDPDEPGETHTGVVEEEPHELNQTAGANNEENDADEEQTPDANPFNTVVEDNATKPETEYTDNINADSEKNNFVIKDQCLEPSASTSIEDNRSTLDKDTGENDYEVHELRKTEEINTEIEKGSFDIKVDSPYRNSISEDFPKPDNEETTVVSELNETCIISNKFDEEVKDDKITHEVLKHAMNASDVNETDFSTEEYDAASHEGFQIGAIKDKTVKDSEVENHTESLENIEDIKLNEEEICKEQTEYISKNENDKEIDDEEAKKNSKSEGKEETSNNVNCMEMNEDADKNIFSKEEIYDKNTDPSKDVSENVNKEIFEQVKSSILVEQFNAFKENDYIKENIKDMTGEENILDSSRREKTDAETEEIENFDNNRSFQANLKEELESIRQISELTENIENNESCKVEEFEKETAVDSEKSDSIVDESLENKDAEDIEINSNSASCKIALKEIEICNELKEVNFQNKEISEAEKKQIDENFLTHSENVEELVDNINNKDTHEDNLLEEQQSEKNMSHQTIENEEDSIEKDSIEDADNYQTTEKLEAESEDLCLNLEKQDFERTVEVNIDKLNTENTEESNQILDSIKSDDGIEKPEENDTENEVLKSDVRKSFDATFKTAGTEENVIEKTEKNTANYSKGNDETDLDSEKIVETEIPAVSKNEIIDSDTAEEDTSDKKIYSIVKDEADGLKNNLPCEQQKENSFSNFEIIDSDVSEINEKNEETNNNAIKSSFTDILKNTKEQEAINDGLIKTCEGNMFTSCSMTMHESIKTEREETISKKFTDQEAVRKTEKDKSDKPEYPLSDSAKMISPRKGIKVEEDEIETAISSIDFYDEMSDGNEQIIQTVSADEFSKPLGENDIISSENILIKSEDTNITTEEKADAENINTEQVSFEATCEDGELGTVGTKTQPSTSPKKRKKKRKISRSRSAQKDGPTSATKRSQDSKGSARTSRSVSSTSARSPSTGEKKLPPIKAPVGTTPPPNIKQVRSKIGSLDNVTHKPKGGDKKVESVKLEWNAKSKIGSLDYASHKPGGGDKKILTQKLDFKKVQSKVGSKENLKHKPGGGNLKISTEKLDFKAKAAPKVGSLDNAKHKPGGGNVAIKSEKLHFKERATPKIHSRSGSERGSSHGGSETQSPIMPSSPAPPEELPPLNEDENPSSQEECKQENSQEKAECNGGGPGEITQEVPNDASPSQPEVTNAANDATNDTSANDGKGANEDQLIAF